MRQPRRGRIIGITRFEEVFPSGRSNNRRSRHSGLLLLLRRTGAAVDEARIPAGRVTLYAQNVSIPQILAEWARISGARIVNGERVTGGAVTLELVDVPEREVLDILLRRVSGYIIAPRPAGSPGTSTFDPIFIMPTSSAASNPPPGSGLIDPSPAPAQLVSEATRPEPSQSRGRAPENEGEPSNTPPQNSQQLGPRDANGELPRMPLPVQQPTTASRGVPPSPGNPLASRSDRPRHQES